MNELVKCLLQKLKWELFFLMMYFPELGKGNCPNQWGPAEASWGLGEEETECKGQSGPTTLAACRVAVSLSHGDLVHLVLPSAPVAREDAASTVAGKSIIKKGCLFSSRTRGTRQERRGIYRATVTTLK